MMRHGHGSVLVAASGVDFAAWARQREGNGGEVEPASSLSLTRVRRGEHLGH